MDEKGANYRMIEFFCHVLYVQLPTVNSEIYWSSVKHAE